MRKIMIVGLVFIALLAVAGLAYSWCLGPPYGCTTCPTCGSIGQVFLQKEVGSGFNKTCLYYLKCWQGHVWTCAN